MHKITDRYISEMIDGYDRDNLTIAMVCTHTSLRIFSGAKREGLKTIGIFIDKPPRFSDAFPLAKPDRFRSVDSYQEMQDSC